MCDCRRGYQFFRDRLHSGFMNNANITDDKQIEQKLRFAEFLEKGRVYCLILDTSIVIKNVIS